MRGFIRLTLILVILVALWQWLQDQELRARIREIKHADRDGVNPGLDLEAYDDE